MLDLHLPGEPIAPRRAREAVAARLAGHPQLADLLLCLSEVVTNAVLHARTDVHLVVRGHGARVRVEVGDADPTLPRPQDPSPETPTGRGLLIIGQLTSRWGVEGRADGKTVWFEVDG